MAQTAAQMDKPVPPTPISTSPSPTQQAPPPVPLRDTDSEGEGEVMLRLLSEATLESEERLSPKKRTGASRKRRSTAMTEPSPTPSPVSSQQQSANSSNAAAAKSNAAEEDDDAGGGDTEPEIEYEDSSPPKTRSSRLKRGSTTIGDFDSRTGKPMSSPQRPTRLVRHASDLSGVTRHSLDSPPLPGAPSMANINTPNLRRSSSGNGRRTKITNLATLQEVLPLLNEEMLRRIIFQLALKDTDLLPELEKEVSRVYKTDSTDTNENGLVSSPISADESSPMGDNKKRRRKNSEIEKNERCLYPSCSKSYSTKGALKQHMKIKHPNFNPPSLPSSSSSSSSSSLFSSPSPTPTPSPASSASALPLTSSMTSSSSSLGGSFTGGLSTSFAGAPSLLGTGSHSSPIIISPPSPAPTTGDHPSPAPSPLSGSSLSASMDITALEKKEHLASTVEKHTPDKVILVCKSQVEKLINLASQLKQQQSTLSVSKDVGGSHSQPSSPSSPSTAPPASGLSSSTPPSTPNLKQYYDQILKWLKVAYPVYKTAGRETDFFAYLQNLVIAHSGDATLANVVQTTFMRSRSSLSQSSQPMELSQSGLGLSATQSTMSVSQPGF